MLATVAQLLLALTLLGFAAAKLAAPRATRLALATHGISAPRAQTAAWALVVALEIGLGIAVALGSAPAARVAAAMLAAFALLLVRALRAGRAGAPCGCLGARSRVSAAAAARTGMLAVAFALLPLVPATDPTATGWLAIGLALAFAAIAGLGLLVVALAREVGELRQALGPEAALEIPGEGPPLGVRLELIERFGLAGGERPRGDVRFAVALFSSEGCPLCQALEPSLVLFANDPLLAVERFDEAADADVWQALGIPGSPYALVLARDGTVLAQGTFNSLRQLESLVAAAERREREELTHA